LNLPADICNQALDAIDARCVIGDIEEGTKESNVLLRHYAECRRQLLRGAHWDMARKQAAMQLLADASGQNPNVGNLVQAPWLYAYGYPIDCVMVRFVPYTPASGSPIPQGNIAINVNVPMMTNMGAGPPAPGVRLQPARFLVGHDPNYVPQGTPQDSAVAGIAPQGRTVIMTNVPNAIGVYTGDIVYPSLWDPGFRAAFVAYLASEVCLAVSKASEQGRRQLRNEQIAIAKEKLARARVNDGNEGFFSTDIQAEWLRARLASARNVWWWGASDGMPGYTWSGWDRVTFADGSAF
jgi:hypothetical protein